MNAIAANLIAVASRAARRARWWRRALVAAGLLGLGFSASALEEPAPAGDILYPRGSEARPAAAVKEERGFPVTGAVAATGLLAVGGFYLLRRGANGRAAARGPGHGLRIEDTKPLGNRQFLAVAAFGNTRVLLAVSPGKIEKLCELPGGAVGDPLAAPQG